MILINLIAVFPSKICFNFSYKNWYRNVRIKDAFGLWSLVYYSINFQKIRQIPATNQHLSWEYNPFSIKPTVAGVKISKKFLSRSSISLPQASKPRETYFATRKIHQNFEEHDHCHCRHRTFWTKKDKKYIISWSKDLEWIKLKHENSCNYCFFYASLENKLLINCKSHQFHIDFYCIYLFIH